MNYVKCLRPAYFSDTDAIRAHAERGLNQLALGDASHALVVVGAALQHYSVWKAGHRGELVRILDSYNAVLA